MLLSKATHIACYHWALLAPRSTLYNLTLAFLNHIQVLQTKQLLFIQDCRDCRKASLLKLSATASNYNRLFGHGRVRRLMSDLVDVELLEVLLVFLQELLVLLLNHKLLQRLSALRQRSRLCSAQRPVLMQLLQRPRPCSTHTHTHTHEHTPATHTHTHTHSCNPHTHSLWTCSCNTHTSWTHSCNTHRHTHTHTLWTCSCNTHTSWTHSSCTCNPPPGPHHHTEQVSNPGCRRGRQALYQGG